MAKSQSDVIREHFKLADRFLKTAVLVLKEDDLRSAADRAYYAMFHAAQAALRHKGITVKSHKGLIGQFSKEYIKTGTIDPELGRMLQKGFRLRQTSDYELYAILPEKQVQDLVEKAKAFVEHLRETLAVQ